MVEQQGRQIEQLQQQLRSQDDRITAPREYPIAAPAVPNAADAIADDGFVDVGRDLGMAGQWRNGLHMETKDKAFRIHAVGRLQMDGVWIDGDNNVEFGPNGVGDTLDAFAFRRARAGVEGTF